MRKLLRRTVSLEQAVQICRALGKERQMGLLWFLLILPKEYEEQRPPPMSGLSVC